MAKPAKPQLKTARALAVYTLESIKNGAYSNLQLNATIKKFEMAPKDKNLYTTIVYGVIQHRLTLEFWLKPFVKQPQKMQPWLRELLYTAIFQMQFLDKIPKHSIFDETIEIAKQRGHDGQRRFITGVLHQIDREGLPSFDSITDPVERLSVTASLPVWLLEKLNEQVGLAKTESIAASINEAPAQSVRVNRAVTNVDEMLAALEAEGFEVEKSQVAEDGLLVHGGFVAGSQPFLDGYITLQDESAMLVAEVMQLDQPSYKVLDACAAPGGKTTQIASYLEADDGGQVNALDIHDHKVKLINANAQRLHVDDRIVAKAIDARQLSEEFDVASFDRVLVDAPCSGFGLLRRKPEIRYEKQLTDSQNLQKIQLAILDSVASLVKVDGLLTYSTCTILDIENQQVIQQFLANHAEFELAPVVTTNNLPTNANQTLTIYPDDYQSDGFFIANLKRVK
ncbi:16S rRNA (cytosine(967)-C(5))-methyltransferase RsmB [Periweissella fabaria]|uniref:16S rRNA (cytosine(967)-C(5))-methyltransferase n=1 Tax=Periweissella fabaria TaxID=546157 RepID=A0ABM8Z4S9_9LACO|nr:16S rRNA (cytosine(967)-C(5))-methyltransferase RsmB [Periweissella fabaria]MCM0596430.1 16S rRNA (cytosine(967)-C(5))-methyltransferase RsmB [Periweissella fabaria]CAH0415842.1 Ribosomal RNA small subunit methyltransferase B [Periweissella fabaria]